MPRNTRRPTVTSPEQLEQRLLLTVKVSFNEKSGLLKITGDNDINRIQVYGYDDRGEVEVFDDNISVGLFDNVVSIKANLKAGNDELNLTAINIAGNVTANLGDGADVLDLDDQTGNVEDVLFIGGFLKANLGNDPGDFAEFDDGMTIDGNVTLSGVADVDFNGDGATVSTEFGDDIIFRQNLRINFSGFGDVDGDNLELDFDNVVVQGTTLLDGSNNTERFEMTMSGFSEDFTADMDDGDDSININNGPTQKNFFGAQSFFRGGDDNDTLFKGLDNLFALPELIADFETVV